MQPDKLEQPQRQAWLGVAVLYFKNLRNGVNLFLALIFPMVAGWGVGSNYLWYAFYAALIGIGVIAYLQYRNFFFRVAGDKFIINQGVLQKEELSVPFGRIQSVHIHQNIIQQILNVVGLEIETAGSVTKEVSIPALKRSYAEALKSFLLAKKADATVLEEISSVGEVAAESLGPVDEEKIILNLGVLDLLKVGLTENHLRTGMFALAVLFGYLSEYEEYVSDEVDAATRHLETAVNSMVYLIPIGILLFVLLSVLLSTARTVLRYYNLSVALGGGSLTVKGGLLKKQENVVPEGKIQFISWKSNPLRKWIGYQSLAVYQAGSEVINRKNSVQVPGCREAQIEEVNRAFFPELANFESLTELRPVAFYQARLLLYVGIVPALALAVVGWFAGWWFYVVAGAWVMAADYVTRQYVARYSIAVSNDLLRVYRGYIFTEHIILKHYKVQNVALRQSVFQKRRGLATVVIFTAGGRISVPFVPVAAAKSLIDFLLYKVESNTKEWM